MIGDIIFQDVMKKIAGIENGNLVDKTDNETITGAWSLPGTASINGILGSNLVDKSAITSITGNWNFEKPTTIKGEDDSLNTSSFSIKNFSLNSLLTVKNGGAIGIGGAQK